MKRNGEFSTPPAQQEPELIHKEEESSYIKVTDVASNLLLNVSESGLPIYIGDTVIYQDDEGRALSVTVKSNADLLAVPFNPDSGAPSVLPINVDCINSINEQLEFIEMIEDIEDGISVNIPEFTQPMTFRTTDQPSAARSCYLQPHDTTIDRIQLQPNVPVTLPNELTSEPVIALLIEDNYIDRNLYFFTINEAHQNNENFTENIWLRALASPVHSLSSRQRSNDCRVSYEPVTNKASIISQKDRKPLFDDQAITTPQSINQIRQHIFSQIDFGAMESYENDLSIWFNTQKGIKSADTIILQGSGGLGDRVYQVLVAEAVAREYPDKRIVFHCPNLPLDLFDKSPQQNFSIDNTMAGAHLFDKGLNLKKKKTIVISITINTEPVHQYESSSRSTILDMVRNAFTAQDITYFSDRRNSKNSRTKAGLISQWKQFYKKEGNGEEDNNDYAQVAIYNSILERLMGIRSRVKLERNFIKKPEINSDTPKYDVVINYDSLSNGRAKLPTPVQIIAIVKDLQNQGYSVGIVQGKTNPADLDYVLRVCPDVGVISGNLDYVIATIINSKVCLMTDTGIRHIINQIIESEKALPEEARTYEALPEIISLVGKNSGFSHNFFEITQGETILADTFVSALTPSTITDRVKEHLS